MSRVLGRVAVVLCVMPAASLADIVVPGANGADGSFSPTSASTVVDLSFAATVSFADFQAGIDPPGFVPGNGVYIPEQWAVVFRYSSVNIPAGVTVSFTNHPKRAPVVWLVSGAVNVNGTINVSGQNGHGDSPGTAVFSEPGPGGFHGGRGVQLAPGSAGRGPGGGGYQLDSNGAAGSFGTVGATSGVNVAGKTYGSAALVPLLGGSGGSCRAEAYPYAVRAGGGAGGGAILIAATGAIAFSGGTIRARGGDWGNYNGSAGAGGAIRLVCDSALGSATLDARGGSGYTGAGGLGRIQIDANSSTLGGTIQPPLGAPNPPGAAARIWPESTAPRLRVVSLGGAAVTADPAASFTFPLPDVYTAEVDPVIVIEGINVPLTWQLDVRVVPWEGPSIIVSATPQPGSTFELSTWTATIPQLPNGASAITARSYQP